LGGLVECDAQGEISRCAPAGGRAWIAGTPADSKHPEMKKLTVPWFVINAPSKKEMREVVFFLLSP
jgi:hypothetical protein